MVRHGISHAAIIMTYGAARVARAESIVLAGMAVLAVLVALGVRAVLDVTGTAGGREQK